MELRPLSMGLGGPGVGMGPSGSGFGAETPHVGAGRPRNVDETSRDRDAGLEPLSVWGWGPQGIGVKELGPLGTEMGSPTVGLGPLEDQDVGLWGSDPPGIRMWGWGPPEIGVRVCGWVGSSGYGTGVPLGVGLQPASEVGPP